MTDFRSLLERMANELDYLCQLLRDDRREIHALAAEARAALAQTPADGEVAELVTRLRDHHTIPTLKERERVADLLERQPQPAIKRLPDGSQVTEPQDRVLLVPQPQPIPVSERLPEAEPVAWMYRGEGRFSGTTWFEPLEVTTCLEVAQFRAAPDVPIPLYSAHALSLPSEEEAP